MDYEIGKEYYLTHADVKYRYLGHAFEPTDTASRCVIMDDINRASIFCSIEDKNESFYDKGIKFSMKECIAPKYKVLAYDFKECEWWISKCDYESIDAFCLTSTRAKVSSNFLLLKKD